MGSSMGFVPSTTINGLDPLSFFPISHRKNAAGSSATPAVKRATISTS